MIIWLSNIGNFIKEILDSTITSNVVAIVSLVVTFQTMKSAKDIKEEMKKMQITTLEKNRFAQNRPQIIKKLQTHRNSITAAGKLSKGFCREVICVVTEIEGYKELFNDGDFKEIEIIHKEIMKLANRHAEYDDVHVNTCIELLGKLENILNKGEYSL